MNSPVEKQLNVTSVLSASTVNAPLPPAETLDTYELNLALLDEPELKCLAKLQRVLGEAVGITKLLELNTSKLKELPNLGRASLSVLPGLQDRLRQCLITMYNVPEGDEAIQEPRLCVSKQVYPYGWAAIERALIEDFEALLLRESERVRTSMLARWGYTVPVRQLQALGDDFNVSREMIRQDEKKFNQLLPKCLRIHPSVLRVRIESHLEQDLTELMPRLADLFDRHERFYAFLEVCAGMPEKSIQDIQHLDSSGKSRRVMEEFFHVTSSPVMPELLLECFASECGYSKAQSQHALERFIKEGRLRSTPQGLVPQRMKKKAAIAHALLAHPKGLPWKDVSRIVNANNFSEAPLPEVRLDQAFTQCESAYLCGRGMYRHTQYLALDAADVPLLLTEVRDTLLQTGAESANLVDIHRQIAERVGGYGYFELRHAVSLYGEAHGLFFDGLSSNDSVSLSPDVEKIGNRGLLLQELRRAPSGLTMAELASTLRTRSLAMVRVLIHQLQEEGLVIRVDRMMYVSADKAIQGIDIEALGSKMDQFLRESTLPVEIDVVRDEINRSLSLSFSKYLYLAIGRMLSGRYGWFRQRTIFSVVPISFKGLMSLLRSLNAPELPNEVVLARLGQHLRIRPATAELALGWLRAGRRSEELEESL